MKWGIDLRAVAMLRRIARALENILEQMIYSNERSFPLLYDGKALPRKAIIHSGGKKHREVFEDEDN